MGQQWLFTQYQKKTFIKTKNLYLNLVSSFVLQVIRKLKHLDLHWEEVMPICLEFFRDFSLPSLGYPVELDINMIISVSECAIFRHLEIEICLKLYLLTLWLLGGKNHNASTFFTICTVYKASCASIFDLLVNREERCNRCHPDRIGNQNHRLQWKSFRYI